MIDSVFQATDSDGGISPVIGVILMVAVVVVLSALIGVYALELSDSTESNVTAGVETDTTEDGVQVRLNSIGNAEEVIVLVNGSQLDGSKLDATGDSVTVATGADDTVTVVGVGPDGKEDTLQTVEPEEDTTGGSGDPQVVSGGGESGPTGEEVTGVVRIDPPIQGANVISYDTDGVQIDTATTDSEGKYTIEAVENGRIVVSVEGSDSYNGDPLYAAAEKTVSNTSSSIDFDFDETASTSTPARVDNGTAVYVAYQIESSSTNQIGNIHQLQAIRENRTASFELIKNIDASQTSSWSLGYGFEPIGIEDKPFRGSINGRGFVVTGLTIDRPGEYETGMFKFMEDATIKNLGLENVDIRGDYAAGLAGFDENSTISNVYVTGSIKGSSGIVGQVGSAGLIAKKKGGSVSDSYSTASVSGENALGGLISVASESASGKVEITDSYATGDVTVTSGRAQQSGGFVGELRGGIVKSSYATGDVTANEETGAGGFAGEIRESRVESSYATGDVTKPGDERRTGGFVVSVYDARIDGSYATGDVTGGSGTAGFVVSTFDSSSTRSDTTKITNSYATGSVEGRDGGVVGGFIAESGTGFEGVIIRNSYAAGSVTSSGTAENIGGFSGTGNADTTGVYWDLETTGQSSSSGDATGLTTAEMQGGNAESNMSEFNFNSVWTTTSGGYPELQNNPE